MRPPPPAARRRTSLSLDLIYTPAFAAAGQLEDLTDWRRACPTSIHLSQAHLGTGTYEDRIYGLPMSADTSVLLWNKKLFKQAGLDPEKGPTNWAEIEADADKVNALGGDIYGFYFSGACGGCNIFTFTPLVWASGGDILVDDGKRATLDTPQMREAIELLSRPGREGLRARERQDRHRRQLLRRLRHRQDRHRAVGAFAIGNLVKNYPDVEFGVTFLPGKNGGKRVLRRRRQLRRHRRAARRWPRSRSSSNFVYSLEGQTLLAKAGSLPTRGDIADEVLKVLDPRYQIATEAMKIGRTPISPVFNDLINSSTGPWSRC